MIVAVDEFGASLKKQQNRFVLSVGDKEQEFSAEHVDQFILLDSAVISTDAMMLAAQKGIDIVVFSRRGQPCVRVYPCHLGGTTLTRRNQILSYETEKGVKLVLSMIGAKVENMRWLVAALAKSRKNETLFQFARDIGAMHARIPYASNLSKIRDRIRGVEGEASRLYFEALAQVIKPSLYKGVRSQHPAGDLFNAYLNYGYGILYNEIERALLRAGLDPYLGYLHADRYHEPSLVFDFIEEFRQPVVDRAIITLAVRGQIHADDVDASYLLNKAGKRTVSSSVIRRLSEEILFHDRKISFRQIITEQAWSIVHFLNEGTPYSGFVYRW
jgi:CRISPR-associated protein Cas1